jgi:hypothetical protein
MAAAATAELTSRPSRWEEELGRLLETGPSLPRPARIAVRGVLTSLLDEPATDADAARDIRKVLEVLEPALFALR